MRAGLIRLANERLTHDLTMRYSIDRTNQVVKLRLAVGFLALTNTPTNIIQPHKHRKHKHIKKDGFHYFLVVSFVTEDYVLFLAQHLHRNMKRQLSARSVTSLLRHRLNRRQSSTVACRQYFRRPSHDIRNKRTTLRKVVPSWSQSNNTSFVPRRCISSDVEAVWRKTSTRLLEAPMGALEDHKTRKECHLTILWWLNNGPKHEGIRMALLLLDRVNEDEKFGQEADDDELIQDTTAAEKMEEFFTTDLLNLVVNRWRKTAADDPSFFKDHQDLSPRFLSDKMRTYHSSDSTTLKPDIHTFTMIIDGASNDASHGVRVGEDILQWLLLHANENIHLCPNAITFSSLMNCWVKSRLAKAPEQVERLLEQMHELDFEEPDWNVAPNQVTYTTAIDCWAQHGRADRVHLLLREMHEEYSNGNDDLKPNLPAFNGYLVALAKDGDVDKAQLILEQMERLYASGELDKRPTVISYSTVLSSFANSHLNGAAERAEAILRRMSDQGISPNVISYNSVINAYVNSRQIDRAEMLLNEMHETFMQGNIDVRPTVQTYTLVLSGWSKTKAPDSGERGENLLALMKALAKSGELDGPPDIVAYNAALDCWAKSRSKDGVDRARALFVSMAQDGVEPDVYSYNILIRCMTRAGKIKEAESIFQSMPDGIVEPDVTTYNTLLDAWSKSGVREAPGRVVNLFSRIKAHENIKPDLFTYNIMLNFYSKGGHGQRAESLLDEMCQDGSRVKADSVSFNTVISAWSRTRQGNAPQRAEVILDKMLKAGGKVRANSITFNAVMGAWVRSKSPQAFEHCERLFSTMNEMHQTGNWVLKPDAVTYNTLIQACSFSFQEEAPDRAETIFNEMKRRVTPNAMAYGAMIGVWSKSKRPDAGEKAEAYLRELIEKVSSGELEESLRVFEFTATIRAWANSGEPNAIYKADEILHLLLQQLREGKLDTKPDSYLFHAILRLLASSNLSDKPKYADRLLKLMQEYGIKPSKSNIQLLEICYEQRIQKLAS